MISLFLLLGIVVATLPLYSSFSMRPPRRYQLCTRLEMIDTDRLLSWALCDSKNQELSVSVKPSSIGNGNGLFAKVSIQKNEVIMTIPSDKIINLEDAWEDVDLGDAFMYLTDVGGPGAKLASLAGFVAKEIGSGIEKIFRPEQGKDVISNWQPYLDCLPDDKSDHVIWWTGEKVDRLLQGSNIYEEVLATRSEVDIAIENIQAIFWNYHDENILEENLQEESIDEAIETAVRFAFCMLLSRAFEDEDVDCMKLVPVLDMTQHCSNTEHVNIRHETDPSSGEIIVTARRDIKAGEEFFYSYSKTLKPQQFLTAFGFVPNKKGASVRKLLKSRDPLFFPAEKA